MSKLKKIDFSYVIVPLFFLIIHYLLKSRLNILLLKSNESIVIFIIIWILFSLSFKKFNTNQKLSKSIIKIFIVNLSFFILFYAFQFNRIISFSSIRFPFFLILITILEFFIVIGKYFAMIFRYENDSFSKTNLIYSPTLDDQDFFGSFFQIKDAKSVIPINILSQYKIPIDDYDKSNSLFIPLWQKYLKRIPLLFDFINSSIDLLQVNSTKSVIMESETFYNIENFEENSIHLFINLRSLNDFRRINHYFIQVNNILINGGVFVCCGQTITQRWNRFITNYKYLGFLLYFFDFLFRRVFPKLPIFQGWYFMMTKGKDRALSETEIIGRLFYCGFDIINKKEIDDKIYFILKKTQKPSIESNPSYGLILKQKRVGQFNKHIYIYKLRTMHPFSEFLQNFVYNNFGTNDGDKAKNDFRVTSWGRAFRKYWIDEIPMIYNLFKGDLKLFGVRPLSIGKFNMYPKYLQELRVKTKPGLIPPFYVDLPKTQDEMYKSEEIYINRYLKNPIKTDFLYTLKALWNIIIKKARSQ